MLKSTINLLIESVSIFMYYVIQGFSLLCLNGLMFISLWSPFLQRKWKVLRNKINYWFNEHIGC